MVLSPAPPFEPWLDEAAPPAAEYPAPPVPHPDPDVGFLAEYAPFFPEPPLF